MMVSSDASFSILLSNLTDDKIQSHNVHEVYYPASLIKLFASYQASLILKNSCIEQFNKNDIKAAIKNSLAESDNDALSLLYDFVSKSHSGLFKQEDFTNFQKARNFISKFFQELGFSKELALHNKCFSFAPYGMDLKLFLEQGSNKITLSDVEKIMLMIKNDFPDLLEYMQRDGSCEQSEFIYQGLDSTKLDFFYSKAAWTSSVRHDAAYFSYEHKEYILVIMTKGLSDNKGLVANIARSVFSSAAFDKLNFDDLC